MKTIFMALFLLTITAVALATDRNWTGSGDGQAWFDLQNWSPSEVPAAGDDVTIDAEGAGANVLQTFSAKSIMLAGASSSTLTVDNFVNGTVAPDSSSAVAIENRHGGKLVLKGSAGTVVLKGTYKDSEESPANQPSLVFTVQ